MNTRAGLARWRLPAAFWRLVLVGALLAVCLPCVGLAGSDGLPPPAAAPAHHAIELPTHAAVGSHAAGGLPPQAAAPFGAWAAIGASPSALTPHVCHAWPGLLPGPHEAVACRLGAYARAVVALLDAPAAAPALAWATARTPTARRALLQVFLN